MPPCARSSWSWSGGNAAAWRGDLGDPAQQDFGKMDLVGREVAAFVTSHGRWCSYQADCGAVFRLPFCLICCVGRDGPIGAR